MTLKGWTTRKNLLGPAFLAGLASMMPFAAQAETMNGALAKAYAGNPTLNSQRAGLRATDENVPQALGGFRPQVSANASAGASWSEYRQPGGAEADPNTFLAPRTLQLSVTQTIFNGLQTLNSVRSAEAQVLSGREALRNVEQNILFAGVQAYMNVLRDTAILDLRRNNVEVLEEQLRQTRDRFNVGEVTRTDVAQAEAALAQGRADESASEANLRASIATYRQVIGDEPRQLAPGQLAERYLPSNLDAAVRIGLRENPAIVSALHALDAAELQVKVAEGRLYPTLGVSGTVSRRYDYQQRHDILNNATVTASLTVPIYQAGIPDSQVRQAKETAGQARIQVDIQRDSVRQLVVQSWAQLESSRQQIAAAQASVQANEIALAGVREEAKVGQRTTLDVLNAQQALLQARVALVTAQRDRIVNSYQVLGSIGQLSAQRLSLRVPTYNPSTHYEQVKGKWFGLQTPDGR